MARDSMTVIAYAALRLRKRGMTIRAIAAEIGASRSAVAKAISRGYTSLSVAPRGARGRCPHCGGIVVLPCLACSLRPTRDDGGRDAASPVFCQTGIT